jgi:hypothetical protein
MRLTGGRPYATQELCYFLWQQTPNGEVATADRLWRSLEAVKLVLQALAGEPGRPFTGHGPGARLPARPTRWPWHWEY